MRTGVLAQKKGMTRVYDEFGQHVPVTVLQIENLQVTAQKTIDKDGYTAVQVGFGKAKKHRTAKPQLAVFEKNGIEAKKKLVEFRVAEDALLPVGQEIRADHFVAGQFVDVVGTTKGKGFAGAMKRWNFRGLEATHGVSVSHRSHGSTGQRQDPGRTFKNKKMAGHLGVEQITQQNLQIVSVDVERNLILIKGAVPGVDNAYVKVVDAQKRARPANAPYPAVKVAAPKQEEAPAVADAAPEVEAKE